MPFTDYLMESDEEALRLDLKTDPEVVKQQALWAGLKPGMRVADLGCGSGKTSYTLNQLVQPGGETIGVDFSEQRIEFASDKYKAEGLSFNCLDIRNFLSELGKFDFVWVRFVLEYYRSNSFEIVNTVSRLLRKNGILCLIDLDYNCLIHYGISSRIENAIFRIMSLLETQFDFDPYAGRKLYSYLYDMDFSEIDVNITPHHLNFGKVIDSDAFNWSKKVQIAAKKSGYLFEEYERNFEGFLEEFRTAFLNPRRFSYTPMIACRGKKPNL